MTGVGSWLRQTAARALPRATGARLAQRVEAPGSLTGQTFAHIINQMLGMPVELVPLSASVSKELAVLSGAAVALNGTAFVFYRNDGSLLHQLHVIAHEFYHLLAGHSGNDVVGQRIESIVTNALQEQFPGLRPELVAHLVGRCISDSGHHDEEAAEKFALSFTANLGLTNEDASAQKASGEKGRLSRLFSAGEFP